MPWPYNSGTRAEPRRVFLDPAIMRRMPLHTALLVVVIIFWSVIARASDWPMEGADAQHSSATPTPLPDNLQLHWSLDLPALQPAWPDQNRLKDDALYHPIVIGGRMIV